MSSRWVVPSAGGAAVSPVPVPPAFSVVIPVFNGAATVRRAVESALAQVHPAHEVIVVDDGSTDDLDAELSPFGDRISVLRQRNAGVASARNAAVAAASGDFFATLDADDAFHPRRLEVLAELARARPDLDLITTDARFIVAGQPAGTFREHNAFAVVDQRVAIMQSCFVGGWPAVRLRRLRDIGGFDETLRTGSDWDCWLRLILSGSQAGLVDEPYYDYALREGSLTASRVSSLWDRVRLLSKALAVADLTADEQLSLERSLRAHRSRAATTEIAAGGAGRQRLRSLATLPGISRRARALAAAGVLSPSLGRRIAEPDRPPARRLAR